MKTLRKGQHVTITGAAGTVRATVVHVEEPDNLPPINGAPEAERVRQILAERNIVELAMLEYQTVGPVATTSVGKPVLLKPGQHAIFAAVRNSAGKWRDLQGHPLTIQPTGETQ